MVMMTIEVIKSENNNRDNDGEVPKIHAENHWSSLMMGFDAVNMMTFPVLPRGKRGVFDQTYMENVDSCHLNDGVWNASDSLR